MTETTTFPAILSVEARVLPDEDGDLSWLGEWRAPKAGEYWIDRDTGKLHAPDDSVIAVCPSGGCNPDSGTWDTFVCSGNHLPHNRKSWAGISKENLRETLREHGSILNADIHYTFEDWQRAEGYGDSWSFVGVVLVVRYRDAEGNITAAEGGGLWGIEDDSGEDYFLEVAREQLSDIEDELHEAGFSELEIGTAMGRMTTQHAHDSVTDEAEWVSDPDDEVLLARKARKAGLSDGAPLFAVCDKLEEMGLHEAALFARGILDEEGE